MPLVRATGRSWAVLHCLLLVKLNPRTQRFVTGSTACVVQSRYYCQHIGCRIWRPWTGLLAALDYLALALGLCVGRPGAYCYSAAEQGPFRRPPESSDCHADHLRICLFELTNFLLVSIAVEIGPDEEACNTNLGAYLR